MALIPNIVKSSVSADGATTYFTDSTVYGGGNLNRNEVALIFSAVKVDEDQVFTNLTVAAYDPEVVTTFAVTNTEDGHYRTYFLIIPNWDAGITYNQYELVWSTAQNKVYEYINATPTSGHAVTEIAYFSELTNPVSKLGDVGTDEESLNLLYQVYETVIDYITATCYATAVLRLAKENCGQDDDCGCGSKLGKAVRRLHVLLTGMQVAGIRERFLEAERMARKAETYCDECGCLNQ